MISDSELSELINVPKEWRNGDEKIQWPRAHEKFNLEWLETLWKYLCEYSKSDLTMMENFNIIYTTNNNNNNNNTNSLSTNNNTTSHNKKHKAKEANNSNSEAKSIVLFKLSKNSNLVYTPFYSSNDFQFNSNNEIAANGSTTTSSNSEDIDKATTKTNLKANNNNSITEETYGSLIRILNKLGFQCIDSISQTILSHPLFFNYVPNLRINRFNLLRAFRNKYKHASTLKITQDFNALLSEADIKLLQIYLSKIEIFSQASELSSSSSSR